MHGIWKTIAAISAVLSLTTGANALTVPNDAPAPTSEKLLPDSALSWVLGGSAPEGFNFDTFVRNAICRLTYGCATGLGINVAQTGPFGILDSGASPDGGTYVFDTATGDLLLRLSATEAEADANLGSSVAVGDTTVAVGAVDPAGVVAGGVYLFDGATGGSLRKFSAPDGDAAGSFGYSVALNGSSLLVGAPGGNGGTGIAYLLDTTTGDVVQRLAAPAGTSDFGADVAFVEGLVAVSGNAPQGNGANGPTAFLFDGATGNLVGQIGAGQSGNPFGSGGGATQPTANAIGNLAAVQMPAVPLPAPILLLLTALGGVVLTRRTFV